MKLVKNFVLAVLLASFLAISAPAGECTCRALLLTPLRLHKRGMHDSS